MFIEIESRARTIGVFLILEPPTKPMLTEDAGKGFYHSPGWNKDYPRLQILTVEDIRQNSRAAAGTDTTAPLADVYN